MSKEKVEEKINIGRLRPRNDFVIVEAVDVDKSAGGVMLPQTANESKKWVVRVIGPKVEDLNVGDEVEIIGAIGQDVVPLPQRYPSRLFMAKEANVILRVGQ